MSAEGAKRRPRGASRGGLFLGLFFGPTFESNLGPKGKGVKKIIDLGPILIQVGFKSWSKKEPQKWTPSGSSSWASLGALGGHLGPKHVKKGAKRRPKEGSKTELNPGPQKKHEKVSSTHYLQCFIKVERSKKDHFLC